MNLAQKMQKLTDEFIQSETGKKILLIEKTKRRIEEKKNKGEYTLAVFESDLGKDVSPTTRSKIIEYFEDEGFEVVYFRNSYLFGDSSFHLINWGHHSRDAFRPMGSPEFKI